MEFFSFAIVTVAIAALTQWLKQYTLGGWRSQVLLVGVSLVGGGVYLFFQGHINYWLEVVKFVAAANLVYSFLIQYFETPKPTPAA